MQTATEARVELPEQRGTHDPLTATPPRRAGSVRRTSHIDAIRPHKLDAGVHLDAHARDVRTGADGAAELLGETELRAALDEERQLASISADPPEARLAELVGQRLGFGFRGRLAAVFGDTLRGARLLLLLDDLPAAALVSGYALNHAGVSRPGMAQERARKNADLCAGWATEATIIQTIERVGRVPTPMGPAAPDLARGDDPLAWHELPELAAHGVRRQRRLDVVAEGGQLLLDAMFRDSHMDGDGRHTVVHEYELHGAVDAATGEIRAAEATPRVLPWVECPLAAASAEEIIGRNVGELRRWVRRELTGTATCTHLNDLLRSLEDAAALGEQLA